ncbi:hypothetical protein [Herbiconiux daphne]|uniref:Uncharacterized protein n=1 Tax=Herbiconiux daphne TaxID=2970914 RepID=A0ABT2HC60_9MICO|nr:hypothetical protein [Herbiconiux daphne]MCS5737522.1 hypothetical protein [Herbiconiux daphne]
MKTELSEENKTLQALIQQEVRDNPTFGLEQVREMRKSMTPEMIQNEKDWFFSHVGDWINVE